jgi:carbamoyltransferase
MSVVLGLNEFFHDTAACVVVDGRLVALVEQERLDRRKHAPGFALRGPPPWDAIHWCLQRAGLTLRQIDHIAVSFDARGHRPLALLGGLIAGNLQRSHPLDTVRNRTRLEDPASDFVAGLTLGMRRRRAFLRELSSQAGAPIEVVDHHRAHAASTFWPSGFEHSAVVVLDGMSDASPTTLWEGGPDGLRLLRQVAAPSDSLGVLYRTVSLALGFRFMDAGKTMGLAAYGEPRAPFLDMLRVTDQGYRIDWRLVRALCHRHGRRRGDLSQVHKDMAASLQHQLERTGRALAGLSLELSGARRVALAGGVALNCNMNACILAHPGVEEVYVQPGAMDQGCALGAALDLAQRLGDPPRPGGFSVYTGPRWTDDEIERALRAHGARYERVSDPAQAGAELLAARKIVGWFQGPMEFGPRALGSRSVLGNPDRRETRDRVNRLKGREAWRPLAPSVLEDAMDLWFEGAAPSPHMTLTFRFRPEQAARVPAVVHQDGSARVQSVVASEHPLYHRLISAFRDATGLPMVLNTSFNRRGEPIVCTPAQALECFEAMAIDAMVMGPFLLHHHSPGR